MTDTLSTTDYGLIGHPLTHSFSKMFFTRFFAEEGLGMSYDNFDLPVLDAAALYSLVLLNPRLKGLNVTAPYKQQIIQFLDSVEGIAADIEAVNCVRVVRDDDSGRVIRLEGYNTDVEGFTRAIAPMLRGVGCRLALVLGTGGASLAAVQGLIDLDFTVLRVSRSPLGTGTIAYSDVSSGLMQSVGVVVNCTPLGTYPAVDTVPPFPFDTVLPGTVCFDMVYNPEETLFMKKAAARGAVVSNGFDMLCYQAIASWRIWTEREL